MKNPVEKPRANATGKMTKMANLHAGMKRHNPPGHDSSMKMGPANINEGAIRSAAARSPKTLGPRDA